MMENYAEASVSYVNTTKGLVEVREVKIEERAELSLLHDSMDTEFGGSRQNYDFGAEIVKTQSQQHYLQAEALQKHTTAEESGIKTNTTKTLTATACELSVLEVEAAKTIETPVNSASTLPNQTCPELELDKEQPENVDEEADEDDDDDDDDDSYQSEEEDNERRRRRRAYNNRGDDQRDAASQDSDESTTDSDFSDLSGLSDMSGREWKPISARPINWVQRQIHSGANPRDLLSQMLPSSAHQIAPGLTDMTLWRILASLISEPPRRQKLRYINTFEDVVQLVLQSQNIIVLTGAGVSVSCGIPDFRSSDGIYSRLAKDFPDLPDPQAMFDINYFSRDPRPFYKFAREIYPGQFKPSPCHRFIKLLEGRQKLLRNYTQNIDTLEQVAGIKNVIECHGSFSTASCTKCKHKCNADAIRPDIFAQRIPVCPRCQPNVQQSVDASEPVSELELKRLVENGIMKPDIVFFGEGLPQEFHTVMASDKDKCDLLIVMGSSLKVRPVALIPSSIPANVPQILINREQLHHLEFDVELLGDSDVIINQLCHHLADDWKQICFSDEVLKESKDLLPVEEDSTTEGEEDVPQLQDTDTQSIKSNASTDIALRSAGAFSDSGFESSTSSGGVLGKITGDAAANEDINKAIKQLKTSSLELNDDPLSQTKCVDSLPPDLLDEPTETIDDYGNADFHPFAERLGQRSTLCTENYRHLSIDSSKDSGIQGDSSNSALASGSTNTLLPPITSFSDSGGTSANSRNCLDNVSASQKVSAEAAERTVQIATTAESNKIAATNAESDMKRRQQKRQSAAERLIEGTYYSHESSSSYVFPGAQVSWSSDSEEEDNDDDNVEEHGHVDFNEDDTDANGAPLSPLLPPSVEAEVVSEITTTNAFTTCIKRPSSDNLESEVLASAEISTCANAMSCATITHKSNIKTAHGVSEVSNSTTEMLCSPPPTKRRRNSSESPEHMKAEVVVASSSSSNLTTSTNFITTTTINTSDSSSNSLDPSNTTEAWLQQF